MKTMQTLCIPVSLGELIDKITILKIKIERFIDAEKIIHVEYEHNLLNEVVLNYNIHIDSAVLSSYMNELKLANEKIWDAENILRQCEANQIYDEQFIAAARNAYTYNSVRHNIKQAINKQMGSDIFEEKQYG